MLGRLDGENAVKTGEGFYFDLMDQWFESPDLQKEYAHVGYFITHHVQE